MSLFFDAVRACLIDVGVRSAPSYIQSGYLAVLWDPFRWATWAGCPGLLQVPAEESGTHRH